MNDPGPGLPFRGLSVSRVGRDGPNPTRLPLMDQPTPPSAPAAPTWRRPLRRILKNWRERHRHPFNFWIHVIGIPLAVAGVVLFFFVPWYWATTALVLGYALQYAGHRVEGNDVGEWAAIK